MENNWLNLLNLLKKFNIEKDIIPFEKQRKYLMNLLKKNIWSFRI